MTKLPPPFWNRASSASSDISGTATALIFDRWSDVLKAAAAFFRKTLAALINPAAISFLLCTSGGVPPCFHAKSGVYGTHFRPEILLRVLLVPQHSSSLSPPQSALLLYFGGCAPSLHGGERSVRNPLPTREPTSGAPRTAALLVTVTSLF